MAEDPDDLGRLVAAHLDDALDAPGAERLHERLRADPVAREQLLAASRQAAALPRLALEAGLARTPASVPIRPSRSWRLPAVAAAAALTLAVSAWWLTGLPSAGGVSATGAKLVLHRAGQRLSPAQAGQLRVGDVVVAAAGAAHLGWHDEATSVELVEGAVRIDELGLRKRLHLEIGTLRAEVAAQPTDGGLSVVTPFGVVEVVGTRFTVTAGLRVCRVSVEHGAVRVSAAVGQAPVTLAAGFSATLDGETVSPPGPLASLPPATVVPEAAAPEAGADAARVRLGVADFRPDAGWEGDLVDGAIRGRPLTESRVMRVTTPTRRPAGHLALGDGMRCTVRLSVDQPTTLALLLVCDQPSGGDVWLGNLQGERRISAGEQEVVFTRADLRQVTVGSQPPAGSRVVAAAVMCWGPATELRLRWIEFSR